MPTLLVNDLTMYYERHGSGPPLVLINGLGGDVSRGDAIVRPLAERFTVVAFDNRGAGRTDKPDIPYTIDMLAEDTAGLMTALSLGPSAVLGVSMGGRIALTLTLNHPTLVSRLILASTAASRPPLPRLWQISALLESLPLIRSRYPQPRYAYRRQILASETFDVSDRLAEIAVPTLIMHGRRDHLIQFEQAQALHAGIRGSRFIAFEGGHLFMFTRERDAFLRAVTEFLEA